MAVSVQYRELFVIALAHNYFDDDVCTALTLTPTSDCAIRIARDGCLFRSGIGRSAVWFSTKDDQSSILDIDEDIPYSFVLQTNDPEFFTYTSPDWGDANPVDGGLYVSVVRSPTQGGSDGEVQTVSSSDAVVLPLRAHRFRHEFSKNVNDLRVTLHRAHDGKEIWRSKASFGPQKVSDLDLLGVADGRYLLKLDGMVELDFYLTQMQAENMIGIVDIFMTGAGQSAASEQGTIGDFALNFTRRESRWRYFLIDHGQDADLRNARVTGVLAPSVGNADTAAEFSTPVPITLRGKSAWFVESTNRLPLLQSPANYHTIELKPPSNGGIAADSRRLPYATPAGTRFEREGDATQMWSNIYVYL